VVYGRASLAAFRQLSTHGQKFDFSGCYSTKALTMQNFVANE